MLIGRRCPSSSAADVDIESNAYSFLRISSNSFRFLENSIVLRKSIATFLALIALFCLFRGTDCHFVSVWNKLD